MHDVTRSIAVALIVVLVCVLCIAVIGCGKKDTSAVTGNTEGPASVTKSGASKQMTSGAQGPAGGGVRTK